MNIWKQLFSTKKGHGHPENLVKHNMPMGDNLSLMYYELPNVWTAEQLEDEVKTLIERKDYLTLAAINNPINLGRHGYPKEYFWMRDQANRLLIKAGSEAVDSILKVLQIAKAPGTLELAQVLVEIGDKRAVNSLRVHMDKGEFRSDPMVSQGVQEFLFKNEYYLPEEVECSNCGKALRVSEARCLFPGGNRHGGVIWLCSQCWIFHRDSPKDGPQFYVSKENTVVCPHCLRFLKWQADRAGQKATCPFCRTVFVYPILENN